MAAAAKTGKPHGMLSVIGLDDAALEPICAKARAKIGGGAVCCIANYLFPTGRVVSGHKEALTEVRYFERLDTLPVYMHRASDARVYVTV